jgi:vacuolar-type H+-ATPase subunit F/Vma7
MEITAFYKKVREVEATIKEREVLIVSLATGDGGREGVRSEVTRTVAAKLIAEGRARLATFDEIKEYREKAAEALRAAEQLAASKRMQIAVLTEADLKALKSGLTKS